MTDEEKKDLIKTYHERKAANKLRPNLLNPTPGNLRDECLLVYKERYVSGDEDTLRLFFEKNKDGDYSESIEKLDIDKFRPLVGLLRGRVDNPNDKHYRLLCWLMGPAAPGDKEKKGIKKSAKTLATWKVIVSIIAVFAGGSIILWPRGCMYWTGDHYQTSPCDVKSGDTAVIAFDEQKAALKKITRPDTLTYHAIGRVWYIKINKGIEFYTAGGFHPIEGKKKLKPVTIYIIDKYILHK